MPRMTKIRSEMIVCQTIAPFPTTIDRDVFGAWLSGFTDGEGCFHLSLVKGKETGGLKAEFILQLRVDDADVHFLCL